MSLNFETVMVAFICFWLGVIGLVWGSFTDCAVSRWAVGERMFAGRSRCFACGHELGLPDLIPVFSWLFSRGRCRHCGEKIPAECLLAELLGAAGLVCVGLRFAPEAELGIWYFFYSGNPGLLFTALPLLMWVIWWALLLAVLLADAAKRIIPDKLLIALAVNRVVWFFAVGAELDVVVEAAKACAVPVAMLALVLLAERLTRRELMGGGDIKLLLALALYMRWPQMLLALLAGCLAGLAFAAVRRIKRGEMLPFGPFLALGALVTVCFCDPAIDWYFNLF